VLRQQASELGLSVEFVDHLPQRELFECFRQADCFLFPSLHDSGGTVVLEALSFGLPVICLDLCGPAEFVDEACGVVVATAGKSESEVEAALGDALVMMATEPEALTRRSQGALLCAQHHAIENQVGRAMVVVTDALVRKGKTERSAALGRIR
jgi:glycosyltransferase involved in cell wall biosynthesis